MVRNFKKKDSNKIYTVNSVNIHFWDGGYYWFVVFEDEKEVQPHDIGKI